MDCSKRDASGSTTTVTGSAFIERHLLLRTRQGTTGAGANYSGQCEWERVPCVDKVLSAKLSEESYVNYSNDCDINNSNDSLDS